MGLVKNFIEEYGFSPLRDIYVCSRCFRDYGIKEYIIDNADHKECSYCGKWLPNNDIAIHINELLIYLLRCIRTEWGDPNDEGVGWEGGWVSAHVIDSYDLIVDELELEIEHEELRNLILESLSDREWCQKNPHSLRLDEDLIFSWQRFSDQIKHKIRFVFYRTKTSNDYLNESDILKEPYEIMEHFGVLVRDLGLIKKLPKDTAIYRVRISEEGERFNNVESLGPPLKDYAKYSNRMSPAGIPMFYGSLDPDTSLSEILDPEKTDQAIVSIATFITLHELKVLDLTTIPPVPSIFDEKMLDSRLLISFLHAFLRDFTKPIVKNDREHIDYVPTQVITEYFKYIFLDEDSSTIHGILYPSSRQPGGKACVLFFEQKNCDGDEQKEIFPSKKWLFLEKNKTKYLEINKK